MSSSHWALSIADRERNNYAGDQPSSADLAARKPKEGSAAEEKKESPAFEKKEDANKSGNPFGEKSPDSNDPHPLKDGQKNPPLKDGKANPPTKPHKG